MNRTKRVLAIGVLCVGASSLSFGETFVSVGSDDWANTYNTSTALFGAVIPQDGASVQSGLPTAGTGITGKALTSDATGIFTLTYNPGTGLADLTVSDTSGILDSITGVQTLKVAPAGGTLDHVGIALSAGNADQVITLSGIAINGVDTTGGSLISTGQGLFDFTMSPTSDFSGAPFTISGDIKMEWTDGAPGGQISATIVGADAASASPEPGTWALLGSALVGLAMLRRKRIA